MFVKSSVLVFTLCIALCICGSSSSSSSEENLFKFTDACTKKYESKLKALEDEIEKLPNVTLSNDAQCLLACSMEEEGTLDKNTHKVMIDKIDETLRKELNLKDPVSKGVYDLFMKCFKACKAKETTETNGCVAAGKFAKCFYVELDKETTARK